MVAEIDVRATREDDIAALRRLIVVTWHDTYDDTIGRERVTAITGAWHTADNLVSELRDPACISLVAEDDGRLVGHGLARRQEDGEAWLSRLYVLPEHQGAGAGFRLLNELEAQLQPCRTLCLEVEESNHQAQAFYTKNGFRPLRRKTGCGDQADIPTWIFLKRLENVVTNNKIAR